MNHGISCVTSTSLHFPLYSRITSLEVFKTQQKSFPCLCPPHSGHLSSTLSNWFVFPLVQIAIFELTPSIIQTNLFTILNGEFPENKNSLLHLWKPLLYFSTWDTLGTSPMSYGWMNERMTKWINENNDGQIVWYTLIDSVNHKTSHTPLLAQPGREWSRKDTWRLW